MDQFNFIFSFSAYTDGSDGDDILKDRQSEKLLGQDMWMHVPPVGPALRGGRCDHDRRPHEQVHVWPLSHLQSDCREFWENDIGKETIMSLGHTLGSIDILVK